MERYWFRARRYGYGWTPATWEGWVIVALWAAAFLRLTYFLGIQIKATNNWANLFWFIPLAVFITAALVWVSWLKGEPARWRWNNDKK